MCFLCVDLDYCVFVLDSNLISAVYFFITLFTQPFICTLFLLCVRFLEDIESEMRWLQTLSQPQPSKLDQLATKALNNSVNGKTKILGFDQL